MDVSVLYGMLLVVQENEKWRGISKVTKEKYYQYPPNPDMTREEMIKIRWKPYMAIDYQDSGMKLPAECLLSAIDFDAEILTLTPIHEFYEQKEFDANLKYCFIPKRLKAVTVNGKMKDGPIDNIIKAKTLEP